MGMPLKNPPVYFTIVEVRFNTLLKLDDYLPSIQDAMRKAGFPDFASRKIVTLQIAAQGSQGVPPAVVNVEQFLFGNLSKTHMFILNPNAIALQSTRYGQFEDFSEQFSKGLSIVNDVVHLDFTDRVGLRYLDYVAPRSNDNLDQYVVPELRGLGAHLHGEVAYSFSETLSRMGEVQLRSRAVIQDSELAFPPDITPDGMKIDERFIGCRGRHAILDTDGFIDGRVVFSIDTVNEQLHAIHGVISAAFKAAVTEHAFNAWR